MSTVSTVITMLLQSSLSVVCCRPCGRVPVSCQFSPRCWSAGRCQHWWSA